MSDPVHTTAAKPWTSVDVRSARVVRGSAVFAVGLGCAVLVGWTFDVWLLKSVLPGEVSMKPNTAVCLVLLGLGLWCSVPSRPARRRVAVSCAVVVFAAAALMLTEYLLDVNLFLDRGLFQEGVATVATTHPGRTEPDTAAALLLLAGAQLVLSVERGGRAVLVGQVMSLAAALLGMLALYGFAYQVPIPERFFGLTGMAVNTAVAVSVLSAATLFARPASGLMRVLMVRGSSAMLTRRILLATLVVPPTVGWLRLWGQDIGLFGTRLGTALLSIGNVVIFTVIAFVAGTRAARLEEARNAAETTLARHRQLQTMMDNMPAAIFVKDLTGRFQLVNGEFERQISGRVSGTAVGRCDADLFDAATAFEARRRDEVVLAAGEAVQFEDVVVDIDGPRTFLTTLFVLRDDAGDAHAIGGIATDITRQRLAEAKFRGLLEAAPDATVCVDTAGLIVLVNQQAEQLFGYTREDLLGQPVETLVPALNRAAHSAHRERYVAAPVQRHSGAGRQLQAQRKDGSRFPVDISLSAVHTEDGMIVTAAVRDVTARQAAEETNARLASLVEASDDAIIGKTPDGVILTWNPGAERLYGYCAQEMIGGPVAVLCPPGNAEEETALLGQVARGESVKHHETIRLRKDGRSVHVSLSVAPVRDDAGAIVGVSSVAHDITDRMRAEAKLRVQQQHTRMIVDTASDPFISMDEHGVITEWNRRAAEVFGWSRDEVIGRTVAETIIPVTDRDAHRDGLRRLRSGGQERLLDQPREVVAVCHDGRELPVELTAWRLEHDGAVVFNAFLRDITARREITHALASARDQAMEASRLKSQFLASMSHEIRTPMNAVIGLTGLLLSTGLDDTQRRYAQGVSTAGVALLTVINDILDFSKIEAGKVVLEEIDFDLGSLIDDVLELAAEPARRRPVELVGRCDRQLPTVVRGDAGRLRQILLNLASNAVKFTERGEVIVHASPVEGAVQRADQATIRFEVTDTGIGIAETDCARLFEPFTQADAGTTRRFGGTGLGLAICRDLVELMGGTISVQSSPGQGSTFWFTVTLRRTTAGAVATRTHYRTLHGLRVLVVDDNDTNRLVLHDQLTSWGMQPITAASGAAALRELTQGAAGGHPFELAILDMQMPGMDGLELARRITADTSFAPMRLVLLSSGHDLAAEDVRDAGFAATLTKPVRQSHLYDSLVGVLDPGTIAGTASPPTVAPVSPTRGHLLLAEDNDLNQDVALGILANLGYTADVAVNGRQAVAMAAAHTYPAILMDCEMPEMDGYTATAEIRRAEGATGHTPIIAMTASALAEDRERCLAAGMDDHIAKPVMPGDISRTLRNWLTQVSSPGAAAPPAGTPSGGIPAAQTAIEQRLEQLRGPDPDANAIFLPRLLNAMVERAPQHLDDLTRAVNHGEADTARRQAHDLKGIAANLGVPGLATACHEMEALARTGALTGAPEVLIRLRAEVADMQAAVHAVLDTFDPGGNPQRSP